MTSVGKSGLVAGALGLAALAAANAADPAATGAQVGAATVQGELVLAQAPGPVPPATPPQARERRPGGGGSGSAPLNAPDSNEAPTEARREMHFSMGNADVRVDRVSRARRKVRAAARLL